MTDATIEVKENKESICNSQNHTAVTTEEVGHPNSAIATTGKKNCHRSKGSTARLLKVSLKTWRV